MRIACLLLAVAASPQGDDSIVARFRCEPADVEVGEPFELVLELEHPTGASVFDLGADELVLDASWVVFDETRLPPAEAGSPDRRITRRVWTVASLDAGPRTLGDALTPLVFDARISSVDASATTVEVASVLAEGEDAPRPVRGFPEGFGAGVPLVTSQWRYAALAAAALLWGAVLWLVAKRMRAKRGARTPVPVQPLERLARLEADVAASNGGLEEVRELHFELTRLLRDATDARAARPFDAGLTDREWLAEVRASKRVQDPCIDELERLIEQAEAVKYAGVVPTSWALEDAFDRARRALEAVLDTRPAVAAGTASQGGGA